MTKTRVWIHPFVLIIDIVLTVLVFTIAIYLWVLFGRAFANWIGWVQYIPPPSLFGEGLRGVVDAATYWKAKSGSEMGIFFYSTFVTSVWIWLFVASGLVMRSLSGLRLSIRKIGSVFDVENKPLRSIGFVSMVLVTVGFVVLLIV